MIEASIVVEGLPNPGFAAFRERCGRATAPSLIVRSRSPLVADFLRSLRGLGYEVPSPPQSFDYDVLESVYAFEKVQGLERTAWRSLLLDGARQPAVPKPRYRHLAAHIEVDKARQVLYVVRNGKVDVDLPGVDRGPARSVHTRGQVLDLPQGAPGTTRAPSASSTSRCTSPAATRSTAIRPFRRILRPTAVSGCRTW